MNPGARSHGTGSIVDFESLNNYGGKPMYVSPSRVHNLRQVDSETQTTNTLHRYEGILFILINNFNKCIQTQPMR